MSYSKNIINYCDKADFKDMMFIKLSYVKINIIIDLRWVLKLLPIKNKLYNITFLNILITSIDAIKIVRTHNVNDVDDQSYNNNNINNTILNAAPPNLTLLVLILIIINY